MCYNGTFRFKKLDDSFWNGETFRFADYIFAHPSALPQAQNATSNGGDASRVGTERDRERRVKRTLLNNSCIFSDARRVAPISACV